MRIPKNARGLSFRADQRRSPKSHDAGTLLPRVVSSGAGARARALVVGIIWLVALPLITHGAERTQTLALSTGWNAVWLEVSPVYATGDDAGAPKTVADVFTAAAIEDVATPRAPVGTAEFSSSPNEYLFNQPGWKVWRRNSAVGENTLAAIRGNCPYLIFVAGATGVDVDITGEVTFHRPDWSPDHYNLVGFGLLGSVTFDEFFTASDGTHQVGRIYQNSGLYGVYSIEPDGAWTPVDGNAAMVSNEAYWVYAHGPSSFCGPVRMAIPARDALDYGPGTGGVEIPDPQGNPGDTILVNLQELTFTNISDSPQIVKLTKLVPETAGAAALSDDLRIYHVVPDPDGLEYDVGSEGQIVNMESDAIAAQASKTITLGAHRAWDSGAYVRENLYRLELGHNYFWLPVQAGNANLTDAVELPGDSRYQGLWVGQVTLDRVGSITEAGSPVKPTTSVLPMRVIVHVEQTGATSLLSHAMIMNRKTADPSVIPEQVIVVDETKIPYFEGIEERGGKKVGRRIESVGYDLPRKFDVATQAELIDETAAAFEVQPDDVTGEQIKLYVNARDSRPPDLVEEYYLSYPLAGGLGADALLQTESPLLLDPFHRSNPFRHAFHTNHGAGYAIERNIQIAFDQEQQGGLLSGTYTETISGLNSGPITMRGGIQLQRINTVGGLQ